MKIKVDHVTNSSSEVFGVVLADSAVAAGLMFMLDQVVTGLRVASPSTRSYAVQDDLMLMSEEAASRVAQGVSSDAREQEKIVKDAYSEALGTLNKASSALRDEQSKIQKDWEAYAKTTDKSSSEYLSKEQKQNDYLEYLKLQMKQIDLMKSDVEKDKKEADALINDRDAWIQQNQTDYVTLQEQKALLDSLSSTIKVKEGEENPWLECYKELEKREIDIDKSLSGVNAKLEYKAIARGELNPNQETQQLLKQFEELKNQFDAACLSADEATKKKLRIDYEKKAKTLRDEILKANKVELATKASEGIQYGSDVAVDALADMAGPAGTQLKIAYTAIKTLVLGAKDAKKDPKNKSKHLAKAILGASTLALKDQLGDVPYGKEATTLLNTVLQSGLSASIAGTSTAEALGTGLTKGIFDLGGEKGIAALKESTSVEKEKIESSFEAMTVTDVLNDNPLTEKLSETLKTKLIFE